MEENELLKKQVEKLNDQIYQFSLKDLKYETEYKELQTEKEKIRRKLDEKLQEFSKLEESTKLKYEQMEKQIKESFQNKHSDIKEEYLKEMTDLQKQIQMSTIKYEKLMLENQDLKDKIEEISNLIMSKESEFNLMLSNKNTEKEGLMKMLYEVNEEMIVLENKFNNINAELGENNALLANELTVKNQRLTQFEEENLELKEALQNLQVNHKTVTDQLKQKEELFEQLKNQHIVIAS